MRSHSAFTLIEVLISIALLGLILPAIYSSIDLLQDSNSQVYTYLQKSKKETSIAQILYLDIAGSDGNLTINNDEFDRLCIEKTKNSLYGLSGAKVCWLILKKEHILLRVEGNRYHLPLKEEESVEVDATMKGVELFDVDWQKDKVFVLIKKKGERAITFLVQGITKPQVKKKKAKRKNKNKRPVPPDTNRTQIPSKPSGRER